MGNKETEEVEMARQPRRRGGKGDDETNLEQSAFEWCRCWCVHRPCSRLGAQYPSWRKVHMVLRTVHYSIYSNKIRRCRYSTYCTAQYSMLLYGACTVYCTANGDVAWAPENRRLFFNLVWANRATTVNAVLKGPKWWRKRCVNCGSKADTVCALWTWDGIMEHFYIWSLFVTNI